MSLTTPRTTALRTAAVLAAAALALTACGSGGPSGPAGAAGPSAADDKIPTTDVVSGVRKDPAAAKLLPADVRARGTLSLATSVGTPPGAAYLADGKTLAGQDIDFADAVGKVLGLKITARWRASRRSCRPSAAANTTWAPATSASPTSAARPSTS